MKKPLVLCIVIAVKSIVPMELPEHIISKQPPKQSVIEFFLGIKKEHYKARFSELKEMQFIDLLALQLIDKPWHYVEHKINGVFRALCFSSDNMLVLADYQNIYWFDCQKGNKIKSIPYDSYDSLSEICFDNKGERLTVVGRENGYIKDLSLTKPSIKLEYQHKPYRITRMCCNNNDSVLLLAVNDYLIFFYDMNSGLYIHTKRGMYGSVGSMYNICFSTSVPRCAIVNDNNEIIIEDDAAREKISMQKYYTIPYKEDVSSLCFNYDGTQLLVGSYNGDISVFDVGSGVPLWTLFFKEYATALCTDEQSKRIAIGSDSIFDEPICRIIMHYDEYTLEQLMLRKIMHLWLQLKKPDNGICSMKSMLKNIAKLLKLNREDLNNVWLSFPEFMQILIEKTMLTRVAQYKHRDKGVLKKVKTKIKHVFL